MRPCFLLLLIFMAWLPSGLTATGDLPSGIQRPGFGDPHAEVLAQMDGDTPLERVSLFSADNGHYPYFDVFRIYVAITDSATGELQYLSDVVRSTGRELVVEDRDGDGFPELYLKYFRGGEFRVDEKGENLQTEWVYRGVEWSSEAGRFETADTSRPEPEKIRTLIVTGQDGAHWWQGGSDAIEQILENNGLFDAEIAVTPERGGDMGAFHPNFEQYDLVVVNYGGDTWAQEAREDFEKFVAGGGGVVVVHSSLVPMADWGEWNRMTGLGAWEGRDQKSGPWVYWQDGEIVYDRSPGAAGHHTLQHPFTIIHRAPHHPVLEGLPTKWLHFKDELYGKARGPAENMDVLATAWDAPEGGGSGRHEPMLWTVDYGAGRVFVTAMGHAGNDPELRYSMEDTGFQVTLLRGAEWAATGRVTQPVPADFPTAEHYTLRAGFRDPAATGTP